MRIGVSFPHHAIGPDPVAIRDWAQAADDLGIDHLIVYEHIILPDPRSIPTRPSAIPPKQCCSSR